MLNSQEIKRVDTRTQLVKQIIRMLITPKNKKRWKAYKKDRSRTKWIRNACRDKEAQLRDLTHTCLKHLAPITAPLALISPFPYSGGEELSRLFDGHPQILALPNELMIGRILNDFRPAIDRNESPQQWFESIFDEMLPDKCVTDDGQGKKQYAGPPFIFLPHLQRLLFYKDLESKESIKPRDILDAYLTSCFGAWLNYQNTGLVKKFVTAFAPGMEVSSMNMASFFEIYPDGRLILLIKNPENWYRQAIRYEPETYKDILTSLNRWNEYVVTALETQSKFKDRVCLVDFKELGTKTNPVMRYLSDFLEIDYQDVLLTPTFNGIPVAVHREIGSEAGCALDVDSQDSINLNPDELKIIKEMTSEVYQRALSVAGAF
jgi:hypothetical protein